MSALICGSMAYDTIMVFKDHFKKHILPEQIHILNVAFLVPEMRREYGGCAGNIAYNLKALGGEPRIMATVGDDFGPYATRLTNLGLPQTHIKHVEGNFTGQAFITTDLDDNQITAFHPGAMSMSHLNHVKDAKEITLAIVSPDGRDGMLKHSRELNAAGIPFVFDPGQGMPMFSGDELLEMVELSNYVTLNDYEAKMLQEKTGKSLADIAQRVSALIVTMGGDGSMIHADGKQIAIPTPKPKAIVDPTGCGDAYRAGLLYGIQAGWDWETTGRLASLMGSIKIAHAGPQNYKVDFSQVSKRFEAAFGEPL